MAAATIVRAGDRWLEDDRVSVLEEPPSLERRVRALTRLKQAAPKTWAKPLIVLEE